MTSEKYIMICPKCKSIDINMDKSNPLQGAMGLPAMYICNKCGHSGYTFPEIKFSEIEELKEEKEISKKPDSKIEKDDTPLVDTSYGDFQVRIFWKISAPIILFAGIFLLFKEPISGTILTVTGLFMFYTTYFKKRKD